MIQFIGIVALAVALLLFLIIIGGLLVYLPLMALIGWISSKAVKRIENLLINGRF